MGVRLPLPAPIKRPPFWEVVLFWDEFFLILTVSGRLPTMGFVGGRMLIRIIRVARYSARYAHLLLHHAPRPGRSPAPSRTREDMRHAALLIPGFLGTRSVLHPLEERLERAGTPAFSVNLGVHSAHSFERALHLTNQRLVGIRERYPALTHLDVIGHSMGGLVGLDLLHQGAFAGLSVRLVTLGTPFRGTWAALLGIPFSQSAREMVPFWRRQPSLFDLDIPFLSIAGDEDVLAPPSRCRHPDAENYVVQADHAGLLFRKEVFQLIHTFCAPV